MLISIDHGNKQIKTIHCTPFTSGLVESESKPFGSHVLKYKGRYYQVTDRRIPYRKDKTEDERFFVLTDDVINQAVSSNFVKNLYGVANPNELARAIKADPEKLAK